MCFSLYWLRLGFRKVALVLDLCFLRQLLHRAVLLLIGRDRKLRFQCGSFHSYIDRQLELSVKNLFVNQQFDWRFGLSVLTPVSVQVVSQEGGVVCHDACGSCFERRLDVRILVADEQVHLRTERARRQLSHMRKILQYVLKNSIVNFCILYYTLQYPLIMCCTCTLECCRILQYYQQK